MCLDMANSHYRRQVAPYSCRLCQGLIPPATSKLTNDEEKEPSLPSLGRRILTYTQAVAEWIAAGRPERGDEEVQRIYKEYCEKCSWRKRRTNVCRGCGCRVVAYGMAVVNKIKMATQHCPREKW